MTSTTTAPASFLQSIDYRAKNDNILFTFLQIDSTDKIDLRFNSQYQYEKIDLRFNNNNTTDHILSVSVLLSIRSLGIISIGLLASESFGALFFTRPTPLCLYVESHS